MNNYWVQCKLKDIATWSSGGTPSRNDPENFKNGCIPWIKSGELKKKYLENTEEKISVKAIEKSSAKIFPKNSVAVAMYGATIGKASILGIDAATNQAIAVAIVDQSKIISEFLYYYLLSQQKTLILMGQGGAQPNISQQILKNFYFAHPSLKIQKAIVTKINSLFAEIDASLAEIKQLKKQLDLFKQSVLNNIFRVFNQNHNNKSIEIVKLSNIVANPKQDIVDGPFGSNLKSINYISSGTPVIKLQNIKANCFLEKNIDYIDINKATALSRHSYEPEDIIITKLGNPLGIACIMPSNFPNGIIVADLIRLRVNKNKINNKFLCYQINSPNIAQQFEKLTKGTTRPRVNLNLVRSIEVWVPCNEIQKHTAALLDNFFDDTNKICEKITTIEQQLISIKQSILKQAFEGGLI